jgi:hypothetical protein
MRNLRFVLGLAVAAAGCGSADDAPVVTAAPLINLDSTPNLLFRVFGRQAEPQMMPIAVINGNDVLALNLPDDGWKRLDQKYFVTDTAYPTYRDGRPSGQVTVKRGMWTGEPLYSLAGCTNLLPMAAVTLSDTTRLGYVIEQFATTVPVAERPRGRLLPADSVRRIAKRIGYEIGRGVDLDSLTLDSLDFRAVAIETAARVRPTIVLSFIDPRGGSEGTGRGTTSHVFVIADDDGTGYKSSFAHAVNGDASTAEYRSFIDHLDITGDGIDEIFIDGWRYPDAPSPRVFSWRNGTWRETFVGRNSWCVDPPRGGD